MGLLAQYGSDSEDSDQDTAPQPSASSSTARSNPALAPTPPAPKPKVKKPLILGSNNPLLAKLGVRELEHDEEESEGGGSTKKKQKLNDGSGFGSGLATNEGQTKGKGKSSLIDMLPPPKRALPKPPVSTASTSSTAPGSLGSKISNGGGGSDAYKGADGTMLPRNVVKGKGKAPAQAEPEVDFFGIASTSTSTSTPKLPSTSTAAITISSAPLAPDFVPPEPTLSDPYPGYYPLPSGQWAAYDPTYYTSFFAAQQSQQSSSSSGRATKDRSWEGRMMGDLNGEVDLDTVESVDVMGRMNEEKRLLEERKKLTAPDLYSEENTYKAVGKTTGKAGQRHQLSSLLKDAHANRSVLEERIAAAKRNKRDSGAKYGF